MIEYTDLDGKKHRLYIQEIPGSSHKNLIRDTKEDGEWKRTMGKRNTRRKRRMTQDLREALAEQVAEWRENNPIEKALSGHERGAEAQGRRECADDIEELLQEHQE